MDAAALEGRANDFFAARQEVLEAEAKEKPPFIGKPLSRTVVKHEVIPEVEPSPLGVRHHRELDDGTKEWFRGNRYHRPEAEGPARIWPNGKEEYFRNGKWHRENGPAMTAPDGTKNWYRNGHLHRTDGPAVIKADGSEQWWYQDRLVNEEYVKKITAPYGQTV